MDREEILHHRLHPFMVSPGDTSEAILDKMSKTAFQGRNLGMALDIWKEMLSNRVTIFFALSGAMVPAGMGKVLSYLIERRYIDVLVSTGAQLFHDTYETLGYHHYQIFDHVSDAELRRQDITRMHDALADDKQQTQAENAIADFAAGLDNKTYTTREFLHKFGLHLADRTSEDRYGVLATAAKANVPVLCPALGDSVIGTGLAMARYRGRSNLQIDIIKDVVESGLIVKNTEEAGGATAVVVIGGGHPRNFIQQAATLGYIYLGDDKWFNMHHYGIQITTDSPQWGGLSGSTFEEAKSWGKFPDSSKTVTAYCDATIALPLLVTALAEAESRGGIKRPWLPAFGCDGADIKTEFRS